MKLPISALATLLVSTLSFAQQAEKPTIKIGQVATYVIEDRANKRVSEETQTVVSVEGDVVKIRGVSEGRTPPESEGVATSELNTVVNRSGF